MVRGLREKQYQLAAKQHEANLKYNYYKETARFFERESENNRQFDSWSSNEISPQLVKSLKDQKLRQRQSQLQLIFQQEQDQYQKELEELKSAKNPPQDYSIEALRQKLREKKAEESLYLPKDCRRFQSYFYSTRDPSFLLFPKKKSNFEMNFRDTYPWDHDSSETNGSSNPKRSELTRSPIQVPRTSETCMNGKDHHTMYKSQLLGSGVRQALCESSKDESFSKFNSRSRRSLEETNIRQFFSSSNSQLQHSPVSSLQYEKLASLPLSEIKAPNFDEIDDAGEIVPIQIDDKTVEKEAYVDDEKLDIGNSESSCLKENSPNGLKHNSNNYSDERRRLSCIQEKPTKEKLLIQMTRYYVNKDLNAQISDLSKRELLACKKQLWTQAIRLREMVNKLELMKEQNMFNTLQNLMDNTQTSIERRKIDERSAVISKREKIYKNSNIYEEEARELWNKWNHEDDLIENLGSSKQKEILLAELEHEWSNLNEEDKNRAVELRHNVLYKSELQDEFKVAEALKHGDLEVLENHEISLLK